MCRWFVLFVRTGAEEQVVEILKNQLKYGGYLPFIFTKEALFWDKGKPVLFKKILFPGYVVVKTNYSSEEVLSHIKPILSAAEDRIYRVLHYGDSEKNIMMNESEQAMWESLVDSDFCLRASEGMVKNNLLEITSGPLIGKEVQIKSLNKYKNKAVLDVEFAGGLFEMNLVLKVKKKNT